MFQIYAMGSHCLESGVTFSMRAMKLSRNSVLLLDSSSSLQYSLRKRRSRCFRWGREINKQHAVMQHLQPVSLRPREAARHTCGTLPDVSVCSMRGVKPISRRADNNASPAKVRLYSFRAPNATQ